MSRRLRFWMYGGIAFVVSTIFIVLVAIAQGADLTLAATQYILILWIVAAAYASVRGSLLLEKLTRNDGSDQSKKPFLSRLVSGRRHAIDDRMDERRRRVAAAKTKQASQTESSPSESSGAKQS